MRLKQRVEQLEAVKGSGGCVYVDTRHMTKEQAEQAIADAEKQVGKNGTVIIVQYVEKLPPKNGNLLLAVQPEYWDMI